VRDALHQFVYACYGVAGFIGHDRFSLVLAAVPQTLARPAFRSTLRGLLTEPIIGSARRDWNRFSIFICNEIFIATAPAIA